MKTIIIMGLILALMQVVLVGFKITKTLFVEVSWWWVMSPSLIIVIIVAFIALIMHSWKP